jgi:hypothetical protein
MLGDAEEPGHPETEAHVAEAVFNDGTGERDDRDDAASETEAQAAADGIVDDDGADD